MNYKLLFKQILKEVVESKKFDILIFEKYFTDNYTQQVNDKYLNYQQFIKHMKKLKEDTISCKIEFINVICESNKVHSTHRVSVVKTDGTLAEVKVIGLFVFMREKIASTEEMTCLLRGAKEDEDMGSRH